MNDVIGLNSGENSIRVTTSTRIGGVQQPDKLNNFSINVTGPPETRTTLIQTPDSITNIQCYPVSTLNATSTTYLNIDQLSFRATQFGTNLKPSLPFNNPVINMKTAISGDNANIPVTASSGGNYRSLVGFAVGAINTADPIIQASGIGEKVFLNWIHPRDPRDSALDTLLILDIPLGLESRRLKNLPSEKGKSYSVDGKVVVPGVGSDKMPVFRP